MKMLVSLSLLWCGACLFGCYGDTRFQLSAADAIDATAVQIRQTLDEYNGDIKASDRQKRADVRAAFVDRVKLHHANETQLAVDVVQYDEAESRIDADIEVGRLRYETGTGNADALGEIASAMRRMAIASEMTMNRLKDTANDVIARLEKKGVNP